MEVCFLYTFNSQFVCQNRPNLKQCLDFKAKPSLVNMHTIFSTDRVFINILSKVISCFTGRQKATNLTSSKYKKNLVVMPKADRPNHVNRHIPANYHASYTSLMPADRKHQSHANLEAHFSLTNSYLVPYLSNNK